MERCYEYLGCDQRDCIMYGRNDDKNCWEVDGTLCNHEGIQIARGMHDNKVEACLHSGCIYYTKLVIADSL